MSTGPWEKLANYLPTGTFLIFQSVIPIIISSDGPCDSSQKVVAGAFVGVMGLLCLVSAYTDSFYDEQGKQYYGFVTPQGLHCPGMPELVRNNHREQLSDERYHLNSWDVLYSILSTAIFATLALLTSPITICFYPPAGTCFNTASGTKDCVANGIPSTVVRAVPTIVAVFGGFFCALMPKPRAGMGFASPAKGLSPSQGPDAAQGPKDKDRDKAEKGMQADTGHAQVPVQAAPV